MFIIVKSSESGIYTPVKKETYEEAYAWMVERTALNIRDAYETEFDADTVPTSIWELTDEEVIEWARNHIARFSLTEKSSYFEDDIGNVKMMRIFDFDKI